MSSATPPLVESFRFGRIFIDGRQYRRDVIVFPDGVQENWVRGESHLLLVQDLGAVFERAPRTLVIGTGVFGSMKVAPETPHRLETEGIEGVVLPSAEACDEYNRRREQERTALAIHLTC